MVAPVSTVADLQHLAVFSNLVQHKTQEPQNGGIYLQSAVPFVLILTITFFSFLSKSGESMFF
jgi:hypothetical protein